MAGSVNKAIIIGNVGGDPTIRTFNDGTKAASFSVATSQRWRDKNTNETKEKTEWHKVSVSGNLAGIVENYVKKGSKVYVEGALETRKWTDQSGIERYVTEIAVRGFGGTITLLDKREGNPQGQSQSTEYDQSPHQPASASGYHSTPDLDEDIPF